MESKKVGATTMPTEFFYQDGSRRAGPLTAAELRSMARDGLAVPEGHVRKGRDGRWIPATEVGGLFPPTSQFPAQSVAVTEAAFPDLEPVELEAPTLPRTFVAAEPTPVARRRGQRPPIPGWTSIAVAFLFLVSLGAFGFGWLIFFQAKSAIHEIAALVTILIAIVALIGAGLLNLCAQIAVSLRD